MITISEARSRVLQQASTSRPIERPLLESIGCVLSAAVASDIDSPPHDKSLMDGFAVRSADGITAGVELEVLQRVTAGELPSVALRPGTAVQIMTGAPLPEGADAVVIVEQTESDRETLPGRVRITADRVQAGQNIMRRGAAIERGEVVLPAGHEVRAVDIGLLAEAGCCQLPVFAPPRAAVLATGNELVPAHQPPAAGMLRNSNGPLLCALAAQSQADVTDLGIAPDRLLALREAVERGLQHDVLVVSGGVSAGVLDLVPQVLAQLGVEQIFHKVKLKPGKPMWFGRSSSATRSCLVFGLPGNPVGSLVCFELFVAPVLRKIAGHQRVVCEPISGRLATDHQHRSDRPTYHPARAERTNEGGLQVTPIRWSGSSDQFALAQANCLMLLPARSCQLQCGEPVRIVPLGGRPL